MGTLIRVPGAPLLGGGLGNGWRIAKPPATNLLTNSDAIKLWTATGALSHPHVGRDPLGHPVTRIEETTISSQHSFAPASYSFTSGLRYTFSAKVAEETARYLQLLLPGTPFGVNAWANFDLQDGVLGTVASSATASIKSLRDGFFWISVTATATSTGSGAATLFFANAATMSRALGYVGTGATCLISSVQLEVSSTPSPHVSTAPAVSFTGNTASTIVGAIRWDAWQHTTADTIRAAVETSLGPSKYHWRLPFFATENSSSSVTIAGTQEDMDNEIAYAADAGLDYWAFFWYGAASSNGMKTAWDYYQASPRKNDVNWCLFFSGVAPLEGDVANDLANIVSLMGQSNYQKTAAGRPLVFVYDDNASKATLAASITTLRNAATGAGLGDPYISFTQSTPDAAVISTYGFDATTSYTPVNSVSSAKAFSVLDTAARAEWASQLAASVPTVPCFSLGWDRRPRVENPVPWEGAAGSISDYYYDVRMSDISTHIDACLAWVRDNPTAAPANAVIAYAWNEHDEGGWLCPTLGAKGGANRGHLDALKAVLT